MSRILRLWRNTKQKQRRSAQKIVDNIDKKSNTNVNEWTVRDRVNRGIEEAAPCQGRKGVVRKVNCRMLFFPLYDHILHLKMQTDPLCQTHKRRALILAKNESYDTRNLAIALFKCE